MTADTPVTRDTGNGRALWYTGPGQCGLRTASCEAPRSGEVRVQTLLQRRQPGHRGACHPGRGSDERVATYAGSLPGGRLPFPVKYGYANVGRVRDGDPGLVGRVVFSLYPHQSDFTLPSDACVPVPDGVPAERAVLAANMETALNALWDGKPSPGDHICVVGGGVVGLLTAYVAGRLPGSKVTLVDTDPRRSAVAEALGLEFALPDAAPRDQDLVFHTSASAPGLATALRCAGDGTAVVEMSWYGATAVEAPLGADFHCRRLRLISSQVGTIPAERQARWTYRRRLETALTLLRDPALDGLISHRLPFDDLPQRLPEVLNRQADVLAALVVYDPDRH